MSRWWEEHARLRDELGDAGWLRYLDQQEAEHARRRTAVTHRRLKNGQLVQRPPSLDGVDEQLAHWKENLDAVIDALQVAQAREAALAGGSAVDESRFPVLKKGR